MNQQDNTYLNAVDELLEFGRSSSDRTGTGTIKVAGMSMRFCMTDGFPLLTSKFVPLKMVARELEMFLRGITNNKFLTDENVHIWDAFTNEDGELGPIYGAMWRRWPGDDFAVHDQIENLMKGLKENPMSRRHLVTGWNPDVLPVEGISHAENVNAGLQALPPCHTMWQVHCFELTREERVSKAIEIGYSALFSDDEATAHAVLDSFGVPKYGVSLQLYQRSADMFLGVPFNIASYSLLLHYIAHSLNMLPGEFIWNGGDCHIYKNHVDQIKEQISRRKDAPRSPTIKIKGEPKALWDYSFADVELIGYNPMPAIKGEMAV